MSALAILAGCAAPQPAEQPPATANTAPPAETARAVAPPPPPPEPAIVGPDPRDMIGWPTEKLTKAFGAASLVRRDHGSEIRQYRTQKCVLFVFLYPESGANVVKHIETRGDVDVHDCVTALVRAHPRPSG